MTDTQVLLSKIAALRQRLEQAQGLVRAADTVAADLLQHGDAAKALQAKVEAGARQQSLLDTALRQLPGAAAAAGDGASLPAQLTSRAARLLRHAHALLSQLRALGDNAMLPGANADPLAQLYRETASMTDTVVRTVQAFPSAPSAQMRLCEGLEAVLNVVGDRLAIITATLQERRREATLCNSLAEILTALVDGCSVEIKTLESIGESVLEDARTGAPMHFPEIGPDDLPRHIAAHSLAVSQVIARLTCHEGDWRGRPLEPIVAALIHDVGMVKLPASLVGQAEPLNDEQRRAIETHAILGADMATRLTPSAGWLVEAAGQHHERLDGTGYPGGLCDLQIKDLVRLLAVCDVYAAMCQPRAHRPALDTRTALTDTLLLAEKGGVDRSLAERLLHLSFYPVGSVVELSDGAVAMVVATHQGRRDLNSPARPVVAMLCDAHGRMLPRPRHMDMAEVAGCSILRGLPAAERRERLGRRDAELVGW
jgi:HD-GYP domain-containing protein (c-di-GMP phosphodiesterase class II)